LVIAASVAVQGDPDLFGVTHICLQPLVLLGLAFVAAPVASMPRTRLTGFGLALVLLWIVDFTAGLPLPFRRQAYVLGWQPGMDLSQYALSLNALALINLAAKLNLHQGFLRDFLQWTPGITAAWAALVLGVTLVLALRARRTPAGDLED